MKTVVLSLGGSLIVPDKVDVLFLKKLRKIILDFVKKKNRVIIVCGGGKVCRDYNSSAEKIVKVSNVDLDRMGIKATELNVQNIKESSSMYRYKRMSELINRNEKIDYFEVAKILSFDINFKP